MTRARTASRIILRYNRQGGRRISTLVVLMPADRQEIDANGRSGTRSFSQRFKTEIKPMDKASEAIFALEPVTFQSQQRDRSRRQLAVWARSRRRGEGEPRIGGAGRRPDGLHRSLLSGERDVAK